MWFPRIKLRSSGLCGKLFTQLAISSYTYPDHLCISLCFLFKLLWVIEKEAETTVNPDGLT